MTTIWVAVISVVAGAVLYHFVAAKNPTVKL